ncbi:RNA-dependent RNA polymerase [Geosmithia morbida]|uniref:RNA-dependent RNA polymerase n=1 Tax=Geosmithia morbida TaxID=1094350 RepID=A0A9P4YPP4_9HYPO|nr:RNA-dependent RNA polymerase [Geosmithia morbida]KAF4119336.1 RNA-dependent RNA polymerase [Geosmithia morbida]
MQRGPSTASSFITQALSLPLLAKELNEQLRSIWPPSPACLDHAPLAITWEMTRIAIHCGVDLREFDLEYDPGPAGSWWHDRDQFMSMIEKHPLFCGKELPAASDMDAWNAAMHSFKTGDKSVILVAELERHSVGKAQSFKLKPRPLGLERGHRLDRRFGADRFFELILPPRQLNVKKAVKEAELEALSQWLSGQHHDFLSRTWLPIFVRDDKKRVKDLGTVATSKGVPVQRVTFFSVNGYQFRPRGFPTLEEAEDPKRRSELSYADFLQWAVALGDSAGQAIPKLFSRISLSLSRNIPTVVLEKHQMTHCSSDLLPYPDGGEKVMNDGVGTMSRGLAEKIWYCIRPDSHPADTPSAFQGRIGSAKGLWIIDPLDSSDDIWIKTYPSQRKFACPFDDVHHRTFEVIGWPKKLSTAYLNQQVILILEARSKDPEKMRRVVGKHLMTTITEELDQQMRALDDPLNYILLMDRYGVVRTVDRQTHDCVQYIGGMPNSKSEAVITLLASGFQPRMKYVREAIWEMHESQMTLLQNKQKIHVPCSTYAYMAADFAHVLQPGEIHLSFSEKFAAGDFSDTLLEGMDVLVARLPAHFPSDIQKVRVVSKPELRKLKDIVIFPTLGPYPLADLLSGGDYDGDKAWVCWDQDIVSNFENEPQHPPEYDFVAEGYLEKEKLCYHDKSVASKEAIVMGSLLSNLVDQAKAGTTFTDAAWERFRKDRLQKHGDYDKPEYKNATMDDTKNNKRPQDMHILDYLKFEVAQGPIMEANKAFSKALGREDDTVLDWDLTSVSNEVEMRMDRGLWKELSQSLRTELQALFDEWDCTKARMRKDQVAGLPYQRFIKATWTKWLEIAPAPHLRQHEAISGMNERWSRNPTLDKLQEAKDGKDDDWSAQFSQWNLFKASFTFFAFYRRNYTFAWETAGRQLCHIKCRIASEVGDRANTSSVLVSPRVWAAMKPNSKHILAQMAKMNDARQDVFYDDEDDGDDVDCLDYYEQEYADSIIGDD